MDISPQECPSYWPTELSNLRVREFREEEERDERLYFIVENVGSATTSFYAEILYRDAEGQLMRIVYCGIDALSPGSEGGTSRGVPREDGVVSLEVRLRAFEPLEGARVYQYNVARNALKLETRQDEEGNHLVTLTNFSEGDVNNVMVRNLIVHSDEDAPYGQVILSEFYLVGNLKSGETRTVTAVPDALYQIFANALPERGDEAQLFERSDPLTAKP